MRTFRSSSEEEGKRQKRHKETGKRERADGAKRNSKFESSRRNEEGKEDRKTRTGVTKQTVGRRRADLDAGHRDRAGRGARVRRVGKKGSILRLVRERETCGAKRR
jgi:hypothetical protein